MCLSHHAEPVLDMVSCVSAAVFPFPWPAIRVLSIPSKRLLEKSAKLPVLLSGQIVCVGPTLAGCMSIQCQSGGQGAFSHGGRAGVANSPCFWHAFLAKSLFLDRKPPTGRPCFSILRAFFSTCQVFWLFRFNASFSFLFNKKEREKRRNGFHGKQLFLHPCPPESNISVLPC